MNMMTRKSRDSNIVIFYGQTHICGASIWPSMGEQSSIHYHLTVSHMLSKCHGYMWTFFFHTGELNSQGSEVRCSWVQYQCFSHIAPLNKWTSWGYVRTLKQTDFHRWCAGLEKLTSWVMQTQHSAGTTEPFRKTGLILLECVCMFQ